jgi:hypothetical protein
MTRKKIEILLPEGVLAIGLSEEQVAKSWGVSPDQFRSLRAEHPEVVPKARRLGNRKVYSRIEIEDAFHRLPHWDEDRPMGARHNGWAMD